MKKKEFNKWRFEGLNAREKSNKYLTMDRLSEDENKIVVKVADSHLLQTRYGYALILDAKHVVFLKQWAVSVNYYGIEVLLDEQYWNVKEWGDFSEYFGDYEENLKFEHWKDAAKAQQESGNTVNWER